MECPVCNKQFKTERDTMEYILLEEHGECHSCGYTYDYLHGVGREIFGTLFVFTDRYDGAEFSNTRLSYNTVVRLWKVLRYINPLIESIHYRLIARGWAEWIVE